MQTWFEVKAKYVKIDDDGKERKVNETYLVDAVSCTEAEARLTEELLKMVRGEFSVGKVVTSNIIEIFAHETGEYWWKSKISIVTIDEAAGKEKKINNYFLVAADDLKEALKRLEEGLSYILVPYQITALTLSPIVDVFPYFIEDLAGVPKNLISMEEAKNRVLGEPGSKRRDKYEAAMKEELEEVYNSDDDEEGPY